MDSIKILIGKKIMKTILAECAIIVIISTLLFCKPPITSSDSSSQIEVNPQYVSSVNEFGFKLLKRLALKNNNLKENIFISPASILFAVTIANIGADGATKDSIQSALQLRDFTKDEINNSNSMLLKSLMLPDTSVELKIANSIWLNKQYKFKPTFLKTCEQDYFADPFVRDFNNNSTLSELNGWVQDKTNGKITKIIEKLRPSDLLVILDAIYFYGKWAHLFDSSKTKEKTFFLIGGNKRKYPRMHQQGTFDYFENSRYQIVSIPYGNRYSMNVILPREQNGLPDFLNIMTYENLEDLMSRLTKRKGIIELPRFKIDYFVSLLDVLRDLGMGIAFGNSANFSLMTDNTVCISNVLHKTYLDVNENGTEAAAVTAVTITFTESVHPQSKPPFVMIIDHPFFCVIKDNITGLILFSGAIVDPKPNE